MLVSTILSAVEQVVTALSDLAIPGTLTVRTASVYTPGQAQAYSTTNYEIKVVVDKYTFKELMTGQVQGQDARLLIFPFSAIPQPNDVVTVNGRQYRVITNQPTYAGSEIALHEVQGRPVA